MKVPNALRPASVHIRVIILILSGGDVVQPRLIVQIPPHRPLDALLELITYVTDRKGHDLRYAIDSRKLKRELGWEPSL